MAGNPHQFNRLEFGGSLGDLGTLIPLSVGLISLNGLHFTSVLGLVGLLYIASGLYYRLPIPVQPLKVVSAIAIAFPEKITLPIMSATGLLCGGLFVLLAATGLIEMIARLFTKPIIRGIQLGLGLILIQKGLGFIRGQELLLPPLSAEPSLLAIPLNPLIGFFGVLLALFLLNSKRFPAAVVLVGIGILIGVASGALQQTSFRIGPSQLEVFVPSGEDFLTAFWFLVLPQIPLTIGNAIIGTRDAAISLFGTDMTTQRVTNRALSISIGVANLAAGCLAAMPLCHGAGGLAAHYRFGARSGGSNLMIGTIFLVIAVFFGGVGVALLSVIPKAVLGVLLLFAGLELALLVRDVNERNDLFVGLLIAGVALATTHMGIAFAAGMTATLILRWGGIRI